MNYKHLKNKMDKFFSNITPAELQKKLEDKGYKFEEITEEKLERKTSNCVSCKMLKDGVKFRKAPKHTCVLFYEK